MTNWSGLAPAVDSHLARWAEADRNVKLAQLLMENMGDETIVARSMDNDYLRRWLVFGMSYGLPDADGVPKVALQLREREGGWDLIDDPEAILPHELPGVVVTPDGATITGREQYGGDSPHLFQGALMAVREWLMLRRSTTHYVSAEVVREVTLAAELAEPEPLFDTDLFCPSGFAVLEEPIKVPDLDTETGLPVDDVHVWVRAFGWQRHGGIASTIDGTIGEGVSIFWYTTAEDYSNGYMVEMRAKGTPVKAPADYEAQELDGFLPMEVLPWRFGVHWSGRHVAQHIPGTVPQPVGFQRRWFYAFMRLCWQQIIVRRPHHAARHEHRRWDRLAKRRPVALDYTVLRLRRIVDPNYEPTGMGVPLDRRTLVRAHWHYAYCASLGGPARLVNGQMDPTNHRWVWIESFWKGPVDAPIGPLHSATSVVR